MFTGGKSLKSNATLQFPTNIVQVTTLGQPLEVLKTQMAANRSQTMAQSFKAVWSRGGVAGLYQGLIPWVSPQGNTRIFACS